MKKLLSAIALTVCLATSVFAQYEDRFANYTVTPASGSSITDRELIHIELTFHDVENVTYSSSSLYRIYEESEWEKKGQWGECIAIRYSSVIINSTS